MVKYNINELLEKKKALEKQIEEKKKISTSDLTYREESFIDFTNAKNNRVSIIKNRVTLNDVMLNITVLSDELAKIKTAITKFNATILSNKLQERDNVRKKIEVLDIIKLNLPRTNNKGRQTTRTGENNIVCEVCDITVEPMFSLVDVEKMYNQFAAQERKLNTEIQKLNLNAEIDLV